MRHAAALLVVLLPACGSVAPPLEAPRWDRAALGVDDPDVVGAIDLGALRDDPIFGPMIEREAREDDLGILMRGSQIDLVATARAGDLVDWVAVVHGVNGPPGQHDVGSWLGAPHRLASGATEYPGHGDGALLVVPGAWIFGKGEAFERARATVTTAPAAVAMPDHALVASTVLARALPRPREGRFFEATEGLDRATFELIGGAKLEFVLRCDFRDAEAADHAADIAKAEIASLAERDDAASLLVRALVKLDFSVHGSTITSRLTIDDALRELLVRIAEAKARG